MSRCSTKGPIVSFMKETIQGLPVTKDFVVTNSDGFCSQRNYDCLVKNHQDLDWVSKPEDIVGILCSRDFSVSRCIYMPLDDESFEKGVVAHVKEQTTAVPWNEKLPIGYWRGSPTGAFFPTVRFRFAKQTVGSSIIDAKLVYSLNPHNWIKIKNFGELANTEDTRYWQPPATLQDHLRYKYIFIVDGNLISSAHQWVFASGSVPIMITHPDNDYWFKQYLKPMENYVPVDYTLIDLEEKVQWLIDNDDKARIIAENAMRFAETVLSSEFQRDYLRKRIEEVSQIEPV
jgi:Glycosyl transferase family 90